MLAALGVGLSGCSNDVITLGATIDRPAVGQEENTEPADDDAPAQPDAATPGQSDVNVISVGVSTVPTPPVQDTETDEETTDQPKPAPVPVTQGVRPDRPQTRGHSIQRPPKPTDDAQ